MDYSKSVYESRKWLYARVLRISILVLWLICVCSCVFAAENVELSVLSNVSFDSINNKLTSTTGYNTYYIDIEPGYSYTITTINSRYIAFFNDTSVGTSVFDGFTLSSGGTYTFNGGSSKYLYVGQSGSSSSISVTREPLTGQKGAIDNIIYYVLTELWPTFGQLATLIAFVVVFALGYYLLKYYIQRISKGKG